MQFFTLLSYGRSGSTFLKKWLNNHPQIVCMGEKLSTGNRSESLEEFISKQENRFHWRIFQFIYQYPWFGMILSLFFETTLKDYAYYLLSDEPSGSLKVKRGKTFSDFPIRGLKVMYNQLFLFWPIRKYLFREKIIHLLRRNVLAIYVSALAGDRFDLYHSNEEIRLPAIRVPTWNLRLKLAGIRLKQRYFHHLLKKKDCLTIYYEDLFSENQFEILHMILDFLGGEKKNVPVPEMKKTGYSDIRDRISNFKAVENKLRGTGFDYCLD
jgi:LPS sulfotransferase NodH